MMLRRSIDAVVAYPSPRPSPTRGEGEDVSVDDPSPLVGEGGTLLSLSKGLWQWEGEGTDAQPRCAQPGIGKTGCIDAASAGRVTTGLPSRFWTAAETCSGFWPFSSKWIGPPIITRFSILVVLSASTRACGAFDPARLAASAQIWMPSKEKPMLRS